MKKTLALLVALVMIISISGCGNKDKEVAKINETVIMQSQLDQYFPLFAQGQYNISNLEELDKDSEEYKMIEKGALDDLVSLEVMKEYYNKLGRTDILPETVETDFEEFYTGAMANETSKAFIEDYSITKEFLRNTFEMQYYTSAFFNEVSEEITDIDKKVEEYYNSHKDEFYKDQVKASHILVADEALAKELRERALAGEDFATLAKENSTDTATAPNGGDLGFFSQGKMVQEFNDAAFSMKVGEISELVKTDFGYHIIKLTDKFQGTATLEDSYETIYMKIFDEAYKAKMEAVKADMKITVAE